MKMKRSLSLLLSILFAVSLLPGLALPGRAMEAVASGTCGEGLDWALLTNGTLNISIQGPEDEFDPGAFYTEGWSETTHAPWYAHRASILSVRVGEGVLGLGNCAFDGCYALETVSLPDSLEWIGSYVFRGCDSLVSIEVSSENENFYSDEGVLLGDNCLYRYPPAKDNKFYCLPEGTWGSIMTGAFEGAEHLERLYIPEISDISFPVFEGCNSLTKLYLGENMDGWEDDLRSDLPCEGVLILYDATPEDCIKGKEGYSCGENVTWKVEDGVLIISGTGPMEDYARENEEGSWTFWGAPWEDWNPAGDPDENLAQITRLVVEEGVTTVGAGAFGNMPSLESVELPSTLTALGARAFNNDTALKKVEIPNGIVSIGDSTFSDSGLEEIQLPDSLKEIDSWAFANSCLKEIDLPAGLTAIGAWAFYATPLKKIDIPAGVTSIGERAFYECLSLEQFQVDEANTAYQSIGGALFSKDGTEMVSYGAGHTASSYTVPDGVKRLHPSTFSYTEALEEVNLPDSLEEIDNWAFGHTGLKKVLVPAHVTVIQFCAFGACENLVSATLPARLTTLEDWTFGGDKAMTDIFFEGTEDQWVALTEEWEDEILQQVKIHYRYDAYCTHENLIHHPAVPHGCVEDGTIEYWECEACGGCFAGADVNNWIDDITDPAGHDYRSAVTLAPTCSEPGVRTWTCAVCDEGTEGHSYTERIPATGRHHFVDGYCDNILQDGVTVCGAPEQLAGGTLDNGMTWSIDSGGMLHIRGEGEMPDITITALGNNRFTTSAPWFPYSDVITAVRIHSGVTTIGNNSFAGLSQMQSLYVPVSMTRSAGYWTFFQCNSLDDVYYEGTREQWSSIYWFSTNIIEMMNPFGSGYIRIVNYIGNATKHYEYDPDQTYTVTWQNADGAVLETDTGVFPGTEPEYNGETPVKAADAQYTYVFDGWTPEPVTVTGNTVYTARFRQNVNAYTVTWLNEDGTELYSGEAEYRTVPTYNGETPVKAADAQYTYTFDGWFPEPGALTGEAVYTAHYLETVNSYTVTWLDADGRELQSGEAEYGTLPAYDGDPPAKAADAQYTYTFDGWTPEPVSVTENIVYTARFRQTVNAYTVTWRNEDGTVLATDESVPYGTEPEYNGETPVKAADAQYTYTCDGWSPAVEAVTGDVTYTATYSNTLNQYTVTFDAGGHGTAPTAQTVTYGSPATDPGPLTAEGWTFGGWQLNGQAYDFSAAVTGPLTLTAKWTEVRIEVIDVSAGDGAAEGKLPDTKEDFTVEVTVKLPEKLVKDEKIQILMVSYDGEGRFLKMENAALNRTELNTYSAEAKIINSGEVARLKVFILDKGTWVPLTESRELQK